MKNRKWLLVLLTALFLCFMTSTSVFAEDEEEVDTSGNLSDLIDEDYPVGEFILNLFGKIFNLEYEPYEYMDKAKEKEEGGVQLEIEKYPVERYMVNNEDTSGIFGFNLYAINNFFMGIIQNVVRVTDSALQLFTLDRLDRFADDIESISGSIYEVLKENFAEILFAFLCAYLVFIFFTKGNARESFRKFMLFVVVLIVAGYWVSNASYLMKSMNALSGELQGTLVDAGNGILGILDNEREGVYAGINDIDENEKIEGTIAVVRNIYFDLALKRPYLLINYGTTDEEIINKKDEIKDLGFGFQAYPRAERMLAFKLNSKGSAYRIGHAYLEVTKNENTNVASGSAFKQSGLVFLTLFIVIGLSIPFLLLGLINFALQLLAVLIALVLPFAFVISFIPHFAMTGFKTLGNIVTIFLTKGLLGIFLFVVYLLTYSMYLFVKPDDTGTYLLHVVLLIVLFFFIIVKRNKIVSFITAGRVQTVDGNIMPNMNQYYSNQFSNAKKRIEQRRSQKRVSPMDYGDKESDTKQNAKTNRTSMKEERKGIENGKDIDTKRTPQRKKKDDKEKVVPVPLETDNPSKERTKQAENTNEKAIDGVNEENRGHTGSHHNKDRAAERTKQPENTKERDINGVNEENRGHTESHHNKDRAVERTNQPVNMNERNIDSVNEEKRDHTESYHDKDRAVERTNQPENTSERDVNSVKKENRSHTEIHHDTGLEAKRKRELSSVEERKRERDKN